MKYLAKLALVVLVVLVLTALVGAGTASATKLCKVNNPTSCSSHYPVGTKVDTSMQTNQTLIVETPEGTVLDTCLEFTTKGETINTASTGERVKMKLSEMAWIECTKTTDTLKNGSLEVDYITGTSNGTVTGRETEFTINTIFGSCVYGYGATGSHVGTVVGGSPATVNINAIIPKISGNFACPTEARFTAGLAWTEPNPVYLSHN